MIKAKRPLELVRRSVSRDHLDLAFILAYVESRNHHGETTRLIDLVHEKDFGNGPLVNNNLKKLAHKNLITFTENEKYPSEKVICVTDTGYEWLCKVEKDIVSLVSEM